MTADQEEALESLSAVISASEDWADGYSKAPEQHAKLIKAEAKLEVKLIKYFRELAADRVSLYINWFEYQNQNIKAGEVKVMIEDTIDDELAIVMKIIIDDVAYMIELGVEAGAYTYGATSELNRHSAKILEVARKESAKLAKGINETTRGQIARSLEASIALGEDISLATQRLQEVVRDARRAELIARTESVRAFSQGTLQFGLESGAETKTWETVRKACRVCAPLKGETIPITELFGTLRGDAIMGPPGHPRCRCRLVLNYPQT
jgi:hypothetical protein